MKDLEQLLAQWSQQAGLQLERQPESRELLVRLPGRLCLSIELIAEPPSVLLSSVLGPMPAQGCLELLTELMAANCRFAGTDGATIGLDIENDTVVLARQYDFAALNPDALRQAVKSFTEVGEQLRRTIADRGLLPKDPFCQPSPPAGMPV
ncbi:MAG TPA: type III secretion system chaperone [Lentisphaeria bacterium]|nr:type III secretion system chaperone [Lentisphaeria bacterium]